MIKDIVDTRYHLSLRKRESIFRIQDRKLRHDFFTENVADLQFLFMVRNDGTRIHLGTRAGHSQHASDRNDLTCRFFKTDIVFIPWILVTVNGNGYRLRIVAAGTATYRKKQIDIIFTSDPDAFTELFDRRIRHNTAIFHDRFSVILKDLHDLIVESVLLDRTASVNELDVLSVLRKFLV